MELVRGSGRRIARDSEGKGYVIVIGVVIVSFDLLSQCIACCGMNEHWTASHFTKFRNFTGTSFGTFEDRKFTRPSVEDPKTILTDVILYVGNSHNLFADARYRNELNGSRSLSDQLAPQAACLREQIGRRIELRNTAAVHHHDAIGVRDGVQPVSSHGR